jgi:hypothetical protein
VDLWPLGGESFLVDLLSSFLSIGASPNDGIFIMSLILGVKLTLCSEPYAAS